MEGCARRTAGEGRAAVGGGRVWLWRRSRWFLAAHTHTRSSVAVVVVGGGGRRRRRAVRNDEMGDCACVSVYECDRLRDIDTHGRVAAAAAATTIEDRGRWG